MNAKKIHEESSKALVMGEIVVKATVRHCYRPTGMATIKR